MMKNKYSSSMFKGVVICSDRMRHFLDIEPNQKGQAELLK